MRHKHLITKLVFACIVIICLWLFFIYIPNEPKCSRSTYGFNDYRIDRNKTAMYSTSFWEYVYVSSFPQDSLQQLKLMLCYTDSITAGFEIPRKMKNPHGNNLESYIVAFYEIKGNSFLSWIKNWIFRNKNHSIGEVILSRCEEDTQKWKIHLHQSYETTSNGKQIKGTRIFDIFNEYQPVNKENRDTFELELINYFDNLH